MLTQLLHSVKGERTFSASRGIGDRRWWVFELNYVNVERVVRAKKGDLVKDMAAILDILGKTYPDAKCSLDFANPLELLVATVLSAQCTDERVNQVTKTLFKKYRSARDYAASSLEGLEEDIRSTGFFRNKAKTLKSCGVALVERFHGEVPGTLADLVTLPGIGRKTANVILGSSFGTPGIVVDTHVGRVAQRIGLTRHADPVKIEFDLMELIPRERWTDFSHQLIWHGRRICTARSPRCSRCPLLDHCDYGRNNLGKIGPGAGAARPRTPGTRTEAKGKAVGKTRRSR
jgi:endonuclease-3